MPDDSRLPNSLEPLRNLKHVHERFAQLLPDWGE